MKRINQLIIIVLTAMISLNSCSDPKKEDKNKNIMKVDLAIANGTIVTMDNDKTIFEKGMVIINKGKIVEIGTNKTLTGAYEAKEIIDAKGKLVMPGLINTHTHSAMTVFRGIADDMALQKWLTEYIFPAEANFVDEKMVRAGTRLAIVEMLRAGTTTFNDMYYYEDEVGKAAKEIGMRAIISEGLIDFSVPNSDTPEDGIQYVEYLANKWKDDPLITVGVAAHAPYTCSSELIQKAKALADKHNTLFHIHLAETKWEFDTIMQQHRNTPTQYLKELGVLDDNVVAAHSVHLTDDDIQLMADLKVGIAHNPECNMKLASGVAPVASLLDAKAEVGLGTDGAASNNNLDMFQEMHSAALIHKIANNNPTVVNAQTTVEMATIRAAKVLGMENTIGSLEKGKNADLIIVDLSKPHANPIYNIYSLIVYSLDGSDVDTVIINGKVIMKDKKILTADETQIIKEANEIAAKIRKEQANR